MAPNFPHKVTITTPGPPRHDPVTHNELPGTPTVLLSRAYLAARPVTELRSQFEVTATQSTTVSMFDLLLPPGTPIKPTSEVTDEAGLDYVVMGKPVSRPHRHPQFVAASLRLISDLQRS
jgi:hypothetical protein